MLDRSAAPFDTTAERWEAAMGLADFEAAWRESDRILAQRDTAAQNDPTLPYHLRWLWDGRPFQGRRVLVRCYHGLGDTLQFSRFLAPLRRQVCSLTLEIQPELIDFFSGFGGPDKLVGFKPASPVATSDCDLEIMELSHALRLSPRPKPCSKRPVRPVRSALRVGLCWHTSSDWMPARSISPTLLAPLLSLPGVEFFNLSRGTKAPPTLANDCPGTIVKTAKRIATLDLVISIDTMVAHLAGVVGTPLWLLLNAEPDWRWRAGGTGSVWYSGVRKFQQLRPGDWETLLQAVVAELEAAVTKGTFPN